MHTLTSKLMATVFGLLVISATPALADVPIPDEWLGIWELEVNAYDCVTNQLIFSSTSLDTVCPGEVFVDPDPSEFTLECTGSADSDSYTLHCEGSQEVSPGCTVNFSYDANGTLDGNTQNSTSTTNISYTGDCPMIPDFCQRVEITGKRIAGTPNSCEGTPVESRLWSTVKSLYR